MEESLWASPSDSILSQFNIKFKDSEITAERDLAKSGINSE
jgi:hypothetical protein